MTASCGPIATPSNPDAPMPGANNSASGVALLLETARALGRLPPPPVGIDMIFFDGEEGPKSLGAGDPNWFALGSPYFTAHLGDFYATRKPRSGVDFRYGLLPAAQAQTGTVLGRPTPRNETAKFWSIGAAIAPAVFLRMPTPYPISDDQTALTERRDSEPPRHRFRIRSVVQHHARHDRQMLRRKPRRCRTRRCCDICTRNRRRGDNGRPKFIVMTPDRQHGL